jgi:hypothetical protein
MRTLSHSRASRNRCARRARLALVRIRCSVTASASWWFGVISDAPA